MGEAGSTTNGATAFWTENLKGLDAPSFPSFEWKTSDKNPRPGATVQGQFGLSFDTLDSTHGVAVVRAAWAILLSRYTNSADVLFGSQLHGVWPAEIINQSVSDFVPVRIILDPKESCHELIDRIRRQFLEAQGHAQTPVQNLDGLDDTLKAALDFQNVLAIRTAWHDGPESTLPNPASAMASLRHNPALWMTCHLSTSTLTLEAYHDPSLIPTTTTSRLLHHFAQLLSLLLTSQPSAPIHSLSPATPDDIAAITSWQEQQHGLPHASKPFNETTIHTQITRLSTHSPDRPAIDSWDMSLTYSQLDALSTRLAAHLAAHEGVGRGQRVPICAERGAWVPVAALAVAKTGAAFVLLDPAYPRARMEMVCRKVEASVGIVSGGQRERLQGLVGRSLVLDEGSIQKLMPGRERENPEEVDGHEFVPSENPRDPAYVLFTSGSTGEPKGAVVEHGGFVECALAFGREMGMGEGTRALQFASYAFGAALMEMFATLMLGGCVCIPEERERVNDVAGFIRTREVDWALFTPSFVGVLHPDAVPGLRTLVLGGEAITPDSIAAWADRVRLVYAYGQSESATICSCVELKADGDGRNIGRGVGARLWIADASDVDRLAAVGCIGELVVESPGVARGYLGNPGQSESPFVAPPAWANDLTSRHPATRFYKTGDLARYDAHGNIIYLGRKDSQVKIRGQRVELGEVEYHVRTLLPLGTKATAEVVRPSDQVASLIVFISGLSRDADKAKTGLDEDDTDFVETTLAVQLTERLKTILPSHSVPSKYIRLRETPMTATGKTDRRSLRIIGTNLINSTISEVSPPVDGPLRLPETEKETLLCGLWAETLSIPSNRIGLDDSFFGRGGDSIAAIRLVARARDVGIDLTVADMFRHPTLERMAAVSLGNSRSEITDDEPFSLLPDGLDASSARKQAASLCSIDQDRIEDVYPCTPLQTGLMALSLTQPGDYVIRYTLQLSQHVSAANFKNAWTGIVRLTPILRTRIVQIGDLGVFQAVVDEHPDWIEVETSVDEYIEKDKEEPLGMGRPLTRHAIIQGDHDTPVQFVWTIHHALFDGWSLPLIIENVVRICEHKPTVPFVPFSSYMTHLNKFSVSDQESGEYWRLQFSSLDCSHFPSISKPVQKLGASGRAVAFCSLPHSTSSTATKATLVRAALAMVITTHLSSPDAVFGCTVSGRSAPIPGIDRIVGPTIATVPVRISVSGEQSVKDFLDAVQQQSTDMMPFEQTGITRIASVSTEASEACSFRTLLAIQPEDELPNMTDTLGRWKREGDGMDMNTYPLFLECFLNREGIELSARFDERVITQWQVERTLAQLALIMPQLAAAPSSQLVADIETMSDSDLSLIWQWNDNLVPAVDACVHDLVATVVQRSPHSTAIFAWDGELTYTDLDRLSTQLAQHLLSIGVGPGMIVPLCFEKSLWTPVAMLGVMKAGAASVAVDIGQPEGRLRTIMEQLQPSIVLSSVECLTLAQRVSGNTNTVVVGKASMERLSSKLSRDIPLPAISPEDTLFLVFTSGSTGVPKGVVITHNNFSTAMVHQQRELGFTKDSRVLDFASYAFDAVWYNLLHTLFAGGCLCIPSEDDRRNNLTGSIEYLKPNFANLTPRVAELLDRDSLKSLTLVELSGEAATEKQVARIKEVSDLRFAYGPAECSVMATLSAINAPCSNIGFGITTKTWVVNSKNPQKLAPLGSVGELWLEGPLIGRGYYRDSERTESSFVENPPWLSRRAETTGRQSRLYRTGDLVRYNQDGSLQFMGRKDSQVKIRGQRLELGEVEQHVRRLVEQRIAASSQAASLDSLQVIAEVVRPKESEQSVLIAFVVPPRPSSATSEDMLRQNVGLLVKDIENELAEFVPQYMIPSFYIPLAEVPTTTTGKTDRRRLREEYGSCTAMELINLTEQPDGKYLKPKTATEIQLQAIWASVLGKSLDSIKSGESFLRVGGDSISAMQLVGKLRLEGYTVTVSEILRHPRLRDMAEIISAASLDVSEAEPVVPFSLLKPDVSAIDARRHAALICNVPTSQIQDIMPCTPLQEGLLALTAQRSAAYVIHMKLVFEKDVDVSRFCGIWEDIIEEFPILRTRIIEVPGQGIVQAVVDAGVQWHGDDENSLTSEDGIELGTKLSRYAISSSKGSEERVFVWTIHHALYDNWMVSLVLDRAEKRYHGQSDGQTQLQPFAGFIRYINHLDTTAMTDFWAAQFEGIQGQSQEYPHLPSPTYEPHANRVLEVCLEDVSWTSDEFTLATVLRSTWALVQSQYTNTEEATFGAVVTGREAPVHGIENIVGPTLATIPLRISIDGQQSVTQLLSRVQAQAAETSKYEQMGLQNIRAINDDARYACQFQTLLVLQPARSRTGNSSSSLFSKVSAGDEGEHNELINGFNTYALLLLVEPEGRDVRIRFSFDSNVMEEQQVARVANQFDHVLRQICYLGRTKSSAGPRLSDVDWVGPHDLSDIWRWNDNTLTGEDQSCVHDIIVAVAQKQPSSSAICAHDGDLSYATLDELSTKISYNLADVGVMPGSVVALCFEKSKWVPVAMLAVMKAGGASVAMDVTQPEARLLAITEQAKPVVLLTTSATSALARRLGQGAEVIELDSVINSKTAATTVQHTIRPTSSDTLFISFTSGTTGTPKGVIISHSNFTSAVKLQQTELGFRNGQRVLDFASYAFDAAWYNAIHTLTSGGCLCIPSESQRKNDLGGAIIEMHASFANLTPSVAMTLSPAALQSLSVLELAGEAVSERDLSRLREHTQVRIAYGPAEGTVLATVSSFDCHHRNIGRGVGTRTWLVNHASKLLAPIGAIAELWLEGPLVGQGYLNKPDVTDSVFIENPEWLVEGAPGYAGYQSRLYRTGDLVRYNADGSLYFIGRQDSQVKIRGQRVELAEVEHHITKYLARHTPDGLPLIVAEAITLQGMGIPVLVAFVSGSGQQAARHGDSPSSKSTSTQEHIKNAVYGLNDALQSSIPQYMIPTAIIPLQSMPLTATGKTDRRRIRELASAWTIEELADLDISAHRTAERKGPSNPAEIQVLELCAELFETSIAKMSITDNFFRIGGESIQAMRLVALARTKGLVITTADIFQSPCLQDLAKLIKTQTFKVQQVLPFALLGEGLDTRDAVRDAALKCNINEAEIEDIFPCTPLQEGLLAMTARRKNDYVGRLVLELGSEIVVEDFKHAWEEMVTVTPILRTRVVDLGQSGLMQVVLKQQVEWRDFESLDQLESDNEDDMKLGGSLNQIGLFNDEAERKTYFIWSIHHALYDGWSVPLILKSVEGVYKGTKSAPLSSFQPFIKHVLASYGSTAQEYWKNQFSGLQAQQFPILPSSKYQPKADAILEKRVENFSGPPPGFTVSTAIRAAWALLQVLLTGSSEALFGAVANGRQATVPDIERIAGPTIATVPLRVTIDKTRTVAQFLQQIQDQATEMISFEQIGLQNIQRLGPEAEDACRFQTLLVVQPPEHKMHNDDSLSLFSHTQSTERKSLSGLGMFTTHALMLLVQQDPSGLMLQFSHDPNVVPPQRVQRLAQQFTHLLNELCSPGSEPDRPISSLQWIGKEDLTALWAWNRAEPDPVFLPVHALVSASAQRRPNTPAVCAWNGSFTFAQLEKLSDRLARRLNILSIGRGAIVPVSFEKSKWTPIAQIAVMKAGAAFAMMPPSMPAERIRTILGLTDARFVLTSSISGYKQREKEEVLFVDKILEEGEEADWQDLALEEVDPASPAVILFTSGSTGTPKGVILSHRGLATAAERCSRYFGFGDDTRLFQFAPYVFDVSVHETFAALAGGGCLCIPSEEDRLDRPGAALAELNANTVYITPSAVKLLLSNGADRLKTVIFVGELLRQTDVMQCSPNTKCFNWFGPAECALCTADDVQLDPWKSNLIGPMFNSNCWIVDPEHENNLLPIGAVGELVVQGPGLADGYLKNPEKTSASFLKNPPWLTKGTSTRGHPGRAGRLYRTGDLVKYGDDGALYFVGRADSQVKIRGQRVELGEVEHHLQQLLRQQMTTSPRGSDTDDVQVVAEVVTLRDSDVPTLVAFVTFPRAASMTGEQLRTAVGELIGGIEDDLGEVVPHYMIPSGYMPLPALPIAATGKADRKKLREIGKTLSPQHFASAVRHSKDLTPPTTEAEKKLHRLWSLVLNQELNDISIGDSFLRVGGDSIAAMRLVSAARLESLSISVTDILKSPRLGDMAVQLKILSNKVDEAVPPFSLISAKLDTASTRALISTAYGVSPNDVEDVLPCTPLQEGLIAMTAQQQSSYVARVVLQLQASVDIERFRRAWEYTVQSTPILRTRIADLPGQGLVQVITKSAVDWTSSADVKTFLDQENRVTMELGSVLSRQGIVTESPLKVFFMWTVHHALYDNWSMTLVLKTVQEAYRQKSHSAPPLINSFAKFVSHVQSINADDSTAFWKSQMDNIQAEPFPQLPSRTYTPRADTVIDHQINDLEWRSDEFTLATGVRSAWAIVQARHTSPDTIFGAVVTGRQAPISGIEHTSGPTLATVPIRINAKPNSTVEQLLSLVHAQATDMVPYEQVGLQRIRTINSDCERACEFQTLLVIQPQQPEPTTNNLFTERLAGDERTDNSVLNAFNTYALMVLVDLDCQRMRLRVSFDSNVVVKSHVQNLVRQFEHALRQISSPLHTQQELQNIDWLSQGELETIWRWNSEVPVTQSICVHDLISMTINSYPNNIAVEAWDGQLKYRDLKLFSDHLARRLHGSVEPDSIVPLLFEKSKWTPVAMLAVMKAGGASVLLETSQPKGRLRTIVEQVRPKVILTTRTHATLAQDLNASSTVVVVDEDHMRHYDSRISHASAMPSSLVNASNTLYVVFTSGSTGTPKGALVSHSNFASAYKHQSRLHGLGPSSRVLDFASYSFDMAWYNALHTFLSGACLCIPSEKERKENISAAIRWLKPNFANLTPTVAGILEDDVLPTFQVIELAGETCTPDLLTKLKRNGITVRNAYGPAECTAIVSVSGDMKVPSDIGFGAGVSTWVVDVANPNKLASLGCPGELWVEGPLVGRGYLNDPVKTAAAFVVDPPWLVQGGPHSAGRSGRLYRTGDLVRQNSDGSLSFLGRKDSQIKIRGQRVELDDIQHHLQKMLEAAYNESGSRDNNHSVPIQTVTEVVTLRGYSHKTLVAFVVLPNAEGMAEEDHAAAVLKITASLDDRLADVLPQYMIPAAYLPIQHIPLTATAKIDRRRLREIGANTEPRTASVRESIVEPTTDIERCLRDTWSAVLNIPSNEISIDAKFVRLGGDSITAMQVVARCRQRNVNLAIRDLLASQTIRKVAKKCKVISRTALAASNEADDGSAWPLTPVQKLFFKAHPEGLNHFNQSFPLELNKRYSNSAIHVAINSIVERHDMLRARYCQTRNGDWEQRIEAMSESSFSYTKHDINDRMKVLAISQTRQKLLDIRSGPVFAADVFLDANGKVQILVLSAHHLIIDLVSWRIIWHDLQEVLEARALGTRPLSFRTWGELQLRESLSLTSERVLPYSVNPADFEFWGIGKDDNKELHAESYHEWLEPEITALLLGQSNDAFRTEPLEIIVAALSSSFHQIFPSRDVPAVTLEGHGREALEDTDADISETVGWFTTMVPIQVPTPSDDVETTVKIVKDIRSRIPSKGRPYFAYRYQNQGGCKSFGSHDQVEILLNYAGVYQQLESEDALFRRMSDEDGNIINLDLVSPHMTRMALVEVNIAVDKGRMAIGFTVNKLAKYQAELRRWVKVFASALSAVSRTLASRSFDFTLADFPLVPFTYHGLDDLLNSQIADIGLDRSDVQDIYPCTPLQEGIIISQKRGTASYANHLVAKCVSAIGTGLVSTSKLEQAWRIAAKRHSILSTIFVDHSDTGSILQIYLRNAEARVDHHSSGSVDPRLYLQNLPVLSFAARSPQWAVSICRSDRGETAMRVDMSHALSDATSIPILLRDFMKAYDDRPLSPAPAFREVIEQVCKTPASQRLEYWKSFLHGAKPCELPVLSEASTKADDEVDYNLAPVGTPGLASRMYDFCKDHAITRSVFLQLAWALTLSQYLGLTDICFGYLISGRDIDVDNAHELVGPLVNMLISRIDLCTTDVTELLHKVEQDSNEHFAYQHSSLAEIQHELKLGKRRLFNSIITVRDKHVQEEQPDGDLRLVEVSGVDPHEYDILLSAQHSGSETDLALHFRRKSLNADTVSDICQILEQSMLFIIARSAKNPLPNTSSPQCLRSAFFKWRSGVEEETALTFWKQQVDEVEADPFPAMPSAAYLPVINHAHNRTIQHTYRPIDGFSDRIIIWTAWALLQAQYTGSNDVLFKGQIPTTKASSDLVNYSSVTTVPIRIKIDFNSTIESLLSAVHEQEKDITEHGQVGLNFIQAIQSDNDAARSVRTLIRVQSNDSPTGNNEEFLSSDYAVIVDCCMQPEQVALHFRFDPHILGEEQARGISNQFDHILGQVCSPTGRIQRLADVQLVSKQDLRQIWAWNSIAPSTVPDDESVPRVISKVAQNHSAGEAICAWDGTFTHGELDNLSSQIARQLVRLNVRRGTIVPLCLDKSMWTPVVTLAVMKAGGTAFLQPSSVPKARLSSVLARLRSRLILAIVGENLLDLIDSVPCFTIKQFLDMDINCDVPVLPEIMSSQPAMVLVTSGTTGEPKVILWDHGNLSANTKAFTNAIRIDRSSRVYQFASYAFDVSAVETFATLTTGGCICIPSETQRLNDTAGSSERYGCNTLGITPSTGRLLSPEHLPSVSTIVFAGEKLAAGDMSSWTPNHRLFNWYGPAESSAATFCAVDRQTWTNGMIGHASIESRTWVVNPATGQLSAVGAIGELAIEGPVVSHGYMENEKATDAVFIRDPSWLIQGVREYPGRRGRLYRTGDLVRYDANGNLIFIGRKDHQVKIRGQRVELRDIENQIKHTASENTIQDTGEFEQIHVVADVVTLRESHDPALVAFICIPDASDSDMDTLRSRVLGVVHCIEAPIRDVLPPYMIPSVYFELASLPMTASGKVDRRQLRKHAESLTALDGVRSHNISELRPPTTIAETQMQALWASVLGVDEETISADDDFFHVGGDSILAMRLVAAARKKNLSLSVADILRHGKLSELASLSTPITNQPLATPKAFDMLPADDPIGFLRDHILPALDLKDQVVQDTYPVSPFQRECLEDPQDGNPRPPEFVLMDLAASLDTKRLGSSLDALVRHFDILRTVFLKVNGQFLQVVLDSLSLPIETQDVADVETATTALCERHARLPLILGQPSLHLALLQSPSSRRLIIRLSHAQYDGLSVAHLLSTLADIYNGKTPDAPKSYAPFISHLLLPPSPKASSHWRGLLSGVEMSVIPKRAPPQAGANGLQLSSVIQAERTLALPRLPKSAGVTAATAFSAAVALMLAKLTGRGDVLFGRVVSGRQNLAASLQGTVGPCIGVVPVRADVGRLSGEGEGLTGAIRQQVLAGSEFESGGFEEFIRGDETGPERGKGKRGFWCVVNFLNIEEQPATEMGGERVGMRFYEQRDPRAPSWAVTVSAQVKEGGRVRVLVTGGSQACDREMLEGMVEEIGVGLRSLEG